MKPRLWNSESEDRASFKAVRPASVAAAGVAAAVAALLIVLLSPCLLSQLTVYPLPAPQGSPLASACCIAPVADGDGGPLSIRFAAL